MKQFTQEQSAEMYRALRDVYQFLRRCGYDTRVVATALAHADAQPVSAPAADIARAVIADMERPLRIVELNPLDVMEMEEQAGITAADELLSAQIAGEGVEE